MIEEHPENIRFDIVEWQRHFLNNTTPVIDTLIDNIQRTVRNNEVVSKLIQTDRPSFQVSNHYSIKV
jgi:hypothetical protein